MEKALVESYRGIASFAAKERLTIRQFKSRDAMHRFLNTGDNALRWRETSKPLKPGTYLWAGGQWCNVKHCDALTLAHC